MAKKKQTDRDLTMDRMRGLRSIADTGRISKISEFAGFLSIVHPELSQEQIYKLAREMASKD